MVTRASSEQRVNRGSGGWFLGTGGKALPDRKNLILAALDFVNGDRRFKSWLPDAEADLMIEMWRRLGGDKRREANPIAEPEARRAELRGFLEFFMQDRARAVELYVTKLGPAVRPPDILSFPTSQLSKGGSVTRCDVVTTFTWPATLGFVALQLIDDSAGLGKLLCRCRLEGCERFFLARKRKTGRPGREYCKPAHMREAHAKRSAARTRQARADRAEAARLRMDVADYRKMKKAGLSVQELKEQKRRTGV